MALTFDKAHGTQTAVINTEHTLTTQSSAGIYQIVVNLKNMVAGDTLELRIYSKILTGDAQDYLLYSFPGIANAQGDAAAPGSSASGEVLFQCPPVVSAWECVFTLKQVAGTGRSFDWRIDQLS